MNAKEVNAKESLWKVVSDGKSEADNQGTSRRSSRRHILAKSASSQSVVAGRQHFTDADLSSDFALSGRDEFDD